MCEGITVLLVLTAKMDKIIEIPLLQNRSFPATVANLQKMDVLIKDGYAKITANTKFLNLVC